MISMVNLSARFKGWGTGDLRAYLDDLAVKHSAAAQALAEIDKLMDDVTMEISWRIASQRNS